MAGVLLIILLTFTPLVLWYPVSDFSSLKLAMLSLGQMAALCGASLFSLNFILSARFKLLDKLFNGVNRAYIYHHLVGETAFILLLSHPLLISFIYGLRIFLPSVGNIPVLWGILAWCLFISLLVITLFLHLKYHVWKNIHKYLGLALLLAFFHVFLIPSSLSVIPALRWYMLGLMSLGLMAFSYRVVLGKYLVPRRIYKLSKVKELTSQITELTLTPKNGKIDYRPGQFAFIEIESPLLIKEIHPFSFVSDPQENNVMFAIKSSGDYTTQLPRLTPGVLVKIEGGYGKFTYSEYFNHRQLWIAGGIGITPFISMMKDINASSRYRINLTYAVKIKTEAIYTSELEKKARQLINFDYQLYESNKSGVLQASRFIKQFPDIDKYEIFICGPKKMMADLRFQFKAVGVKNSQIHTEEFALN